MNSCARLTVVHVPVAATLFEDYDSGVGGAVSNDGASGDFAVDDTEEGDGFWRRERRVAAPLAAAGRYWSLPLLAATGRCWSQAAPVQKPACTVVAAFRLEQLKSLGGIPMGATLKNFD